MDYISFLSDHGLHDEARWSILNYLKGKAENQAYLQDSPSLSNRELLLYLVLLKPLSSCETCHMTTTGMGQETTTVHRCY